MKRDQSRKVEAFLKNVSANFKNGYNLSPIEVISVSKIFPELSLRHEDILLIHRKIAEGHDDHILLTDKHLYISSKTIAKRWSLDGFNILTNEEKEKHLISVNPEDRKALFDLLETFNGKTSHVEKRDFDNFIKKFKDYTNRTQSEEVAFDLDLLFLEILREEGNRAQEICDRLSKDRSFIDVIDTMMKEGNELHFEVYHLFLQDFIKIYNMVILENRDDKDLKLISVKAKFILAYLFEKLQGNDMTQSLSVERINKMVSTEKFSENVGKISKANFLTPSSAYNNEFLLPSILSRMKHGEFEATSSLLYRVASMLAKADGTINDKEKETLKLVQAKTTHPKKNLVGVHQKEVNPDETLEDVMSELNELIGLEDIKKSIHDLINFLKVQKMREDQGLKATQNSLHTVFMGPPGTGKTTIARLIGRIYKQLGYLEKGHLIETDRAGMVAGHVGQTALKVNEVVKTSIGGVLFLDEAYSLANMGNQNDFGHEAVEALLKRMEDQRSEFVVIAAGYPDEMKSFIQTNPGLQSRFNRYFTFSHYTPQELMAIFELYCRKGDFEVLNDAKEKLMEIFDRLYEQKGNAFGNARVVRNLFEQIIEIQANRIVDITPITKEILTNITEDDIPPILKTVKSVLQFEQED